jgi:hypothetical protein
MDNNGALRQEPAIKATMSQKTPISAFSGGKKTEKNSSGTEGLGQW